MNQGTQKAETNGAEVSPEESRELEVLEASVRRIVAEALARPIEEVGPETSLIDELGAESIDFVDIQFRLESELDFEAGDDELFRGRLPLDDPRYIVGDRLTPRALGELREARPGLNLERFPEGVRVEDLPRLITVRSIAVNARRLSAECP